MIRSSLFQLIIGGLVLAALLVAGYFLFVQTAWGQTFDYKGYFGHAAIDHTARTYDGDLLEIVSKRALLVLAGVVFLIALIRRRFLTGFFAVGALGFAVIGAEWLKHHLPRPDLASPGGVVPPYFAFDTYPSGHTTIGTSAALALLFVAPARWRPWLAAIAGLLSASYGTAVLFMGWHRPSDAVGGVLWSGLCFAAAASALLICSRNWTSPEPASRGAIIFSALTAAAAIAACWLGAEFPEARPAFQLMVTAIICSAFSVTFWFASMSRADAVRRI